MKLITLTQRRLAIVDDEDFDWLNQWKWYCSTKGYAARNLRLGVNKRTLILMHRVILKRMGKSFVGSVVSDHIDMNKLDNRRKNLRVVTPTNSNINRKMPKSKSGFLGVYESGCGDWRVHIKRNAKVNYIGTFKTKEEAVNARKFALDKLL